MARFRLGAAPDSRRGPELQRAGMIHAEASHAHTPVGAEHAFGKQLLQTTALLPVLAALALLQVGSLPATETKTPSLHSRESTRTKVDVAD